MQGQSAGGNDSTSTTGSGISSREWAVLWGLYSSHDPQQQEVLCHELLALPADHVQRYLLQYVYLAVSRPSGPLERAVTQLCSRSFNIAVQVSWLLLALLQDQPGNRHIRLFKDACERAALTGTWMSPFEQAAIQLAEQQQQQQSPQLWPHQPQPQASTHSQSPQTPDQQQQQQQQQQPQQQQQDAAAFVSPPPPHMTHSRSSPAAPGSAAAAAGPGTPTSSAGSDSPAALAAFGSRSSLDLAHKPSLDLAHRFRNSLDLELMRHTSRNDLLLTGSAPGESLSGPAGGGAGGQSASASSAPGVRSKSPAASRLAKHATSPKDGSHPQPQRPDTQHTNKQQQQQQQGDDLPALGSSSQPGRGSSSLQGVAAQSQLYSPSKGITSSSSSSSPHNPKPWGALPGSVASQYGCFADYLSARRRELGLALGPGEGVSDLIEASHDVALGNGPEGIGWVVTHEEELSEFLSMSALMSQPARSPGHAACRDTYLATLDFVEALCETSSNLTRFPPADRKEVLQKCLSRISQEVEAAAGQGVSVQYPIGGCANRVLRLLVDEAAILNSRDKAPFLLLLETCTDDLLSLQTEAAEAEAAAVPGSSSSGSATQPSSTPAAVSAAAAALLPQALQGNRDAAQQQQQQLGRPRSPHKASSLSRASAAGVPVDQQQALPADAQVANTADAADRSQAQQDPQAGVNSSSSSSIQDHSSSTHAEGQQPPSTWLLQPASPRLLQPARPRLLQPASPRLLQPASPRLLQPASPTRQRPASPRQQQQQQVGPDAESALQRSCPSVLELQMQEAAALLRGEPSTQLVRVRLHVQGSGTPAGHLNPAQGPRAVSPQQHSGALLSGQQQWQQWQQQQRRRSSADAASEPWVFGEVPAAAAAVSAAAAGGRTAAAAATAGGGGGGPVRVLIEVAAPAVPHLPLPQAQQQRRKQRRRLPSMEAIDIIAGKLGKSALPAPAEIGPPLHPDPAGSSSSSRRTSSEFDAADAAVISGTSSASSSSGGSSHLPPLTEGKPVVSAQPVPCSAAAAAASAAHGTAQQHQQHQQHQQQHSDRSRQAAGTATGHEWQHVQAPAASAAAAAAVPSGRARRHTDPSPGVKAEAGLVSSRAGRTSTSGLQQQQQQQAPTSPISLWGRLFGSMGSRPQQQQQQQHGPASPQGLRLKAVQHSQQQQQQEGWVAHADAEAAAAERAKRAAAVFGEQWSKVCARNASASPYGHLPGWSLRGCIIKSGDDCRQELLALQLIRELADIWAAAGLPLWVRPFNVCVTSADTALIELIPDAISVHSIKARTRRSSSSSSSSSSGARHNSSTGGGGGGPHSRNGVTPATQQHAGISSGGSSGQRHQQQQAVAGRVRHSYSGGTTSSGSTKAPQAAAAAAVAPPAQPPSPSLSSASVGGSQANLADFFFARWRRGTPECLAAQRRFVESLAGYSLATYFLQVKDRHNGNIMMDASGHLIHIDFGFMLSNTPGGGWVRFEAAPMKLTRELLEVMDSDSEGQPSPLFDYFKVLCIQGFLAARKERARLIGLVRIMADCARPTSPGAPPPPPAAAAAVRQAHSSPAHSPNPSPSSSSSSNKSRTGGAASVSASAGSSGGPGSRGGTAAGGGVQQPATGSAGGGPQAQGYGPPAGSTAPSWPCFKAGADRVVSALEARFAPSMAESACVQHVLWLISSSLDAWSTRTYDYYQLVLNGIL